MTKIKKFIISTALKYFSNGDKVFSIDEKDNNLNEFCEESHCMLLCLYSYQNEILFQKDVYSEKNATMVFYKTRPISFENDENFELLNMTTLQSNSLESFYLSIKTIYGPLLQSENSVNIDPKLLEITTNLESTLRSLARGNDGSPSLTVILTVEDELQYWETIKIDSKTHKQREMAESFISILTSLSQELKTIDNSDPLEIKDIMESSGGLLDDLWRHSLYLYTQKRMANLLDIIGNTCVLKLQEILKSIDLWGNDSSFIPKITECADAALMWVTTCTNLTQKYWPNHSLHVWEGPQHVPQLVKKFHERLLEIIQIRSAHMQLIKLLSVSEQNELNTEKLFEPFQGINIWKYSPQNNALWTKSKSQFEKTIKPAENKIGEKLKTRLSNLSANQMLYEFGKYITLIERPSIFMTLQKERQILLGMIGQLLRDIENQIGVEKNMNGSEFIIPEVSPLVQQIQWTKGMHGKVVQMEIITKKILFDLEGSNDILKQANSVKNSVQDLQTLLYEDWTRSLQIEFNNKTIILSSDMPVVEFNNENNMMRVTFNPRLISIERDIRHMGALGFSVPSNIKDAVNHAAKFMEHARALQQVASFHNTIGERIITSQRPMMLNAAMQLSSLVKEQTTVPWKAVESVAKYVEKLTAAVENLSQQNSFLSSQHIQMRNIVLSLMDTNLLQKQNEWKKGIRHMRDIIEKVEIKGYTNIKIWLNHWNIQLYKALEHQYRTILIDPLSHLPIMKAELIFRQQNIQLQPSLEDIRAACHAHLKKLIALPAHFIGLQTQYTENDSIFSSIIARNSWLVSGAMEEVEKTLDKVLESIQQWRIWGALGSVDLDNLCELHLSHSADWDKNFKECKSLGQIIAKLSMEDEQIDWIIISSASLRNDLETHNRRYWLALTISLQNNVQRDAIALEGYILSVQNTMEKTVPKTVKELSAMNEEFYKLKDRKAQMVLLFEELHKKQKMIRAWSGERIMSLDNLSKKWDNLMQLMENHEKLIAHQTESIKSSLSIDWQNLMNSVDIWYTRWTQNKPKSDQLTNISFLELQQHYKHFTDANEIWENFNTNIKEILDECQKFNIELEQNNSWKKIEETMLHDLKFWDPLKKFTNDLTELSSQEWIIFQKNIHFLDDLILDWKAKVEPFTAITLLIQKEIDKYKEIVPTLKFLRSTDFTQKHWREIYSLLEIVKDNSDEVTLGDLLNASDIIKNKSKDLQKIWMDASHEAIVREAVAELELWLAGARLVIVKHIDNKGKAVPIIKDFKDILSKVEEYQNLAGSARSASNLKDGNSNDQLSIWENRLSHIKNILTSLAHIQRK